MGVEAQAPAFVRGLIDGSRALGQWLRERQPDVLVLNTTHWVSTFNWYVSCHAVHEGICLAEEAPDLIPGLPYRRPGDPGFGRALVETLAAAGAPCHVNDNPHYDWDYGTFVPLQYLDPDATLPVVTLPTVLLADHAECLRVGALVHAAAQRTGRRAAFIASTALTHRLVRGPEQWPVPERVALDERLLGMLEAGRIEQAIAWLPEWSREVVAEMGGRVAAAFLGSLRAWAGAPTRMLRFGPYAQSSASGNVSIAIHPATGAPA